MESGFTMFIHSAAIAIILYLVMRLLGQSDVQAQDRSVLIGAVALIYMIVFGHGAPRRVNPRLF